MSGQQLELSTLSRPWIDESFHGFSERVVAGLVPRQFTNDDLHKIYDEPPKTGHWGSLMARLKKAGLVRKVGYKVSERPTANCRPVSLWEVV